MNAPPRFHLTSGSPDALPPVIADRRFAVVPTPEPEPALTMLPRRRKKPKKPRAITWPAPVPLRPIAWGKRDEILGPAVCSWIETAMPATPWVYTPPREGWFDAIGRWLS